MKYFIATYGCQMNKYDSAVISDKLHDLGIERAENIEDADYIFINGCSVREHAQRRALGFVNSMKSIIKDSTRVYITGCLANSLGDYPDFIDGLIGPNNYNELPQIINSRTFEDKRDLAGNPDYTQSQIRHGVSMFVSIIKGCNNFCSYCIVPYLRGPEESFAPDSIIKQIESSMGELTGEIVLLGQNVNSYNYRGLDFPALLGELAAHFPDKRFKFITSHPYDYSEKLIRTIADNKNICEYIHLPMQSGSDSMLKKMHRKYTADKYLDKIRVTREILENPVITTDIMVGFPGETEDDYKKTMDMVENIRFDDAFMYRYSSRRFTLGSYMEAPPEDIRLKRLKHLIKLQNSIKMERTMSLIGMEAEVLIERPSRKSEHDFIGRDRGERMIVVKGKHKPGDVCTVRINQISGITPIGIKEE